ncbi:MAG: hypothetical protein ABIR78_14210 [Ferruginibacter sp.]
MKKILHTLLTCFIAVCTTAQDVRLNDSVIFINNKPVALYAKGLNSSAPHYNMEVYSFDDYVLIKAEVIKLDAPVIELEPFYYHEITFPPTADTLAIYIEDEDFTRVMAKLISDYDLISKNGLNRKNVTRFINEYYGAYAFRAKLKSIENYLNETRHFNEQVKRDRTKPVTIINDKIIMQDGVEIGFVSMLESAQVVTVPSSIYDPSDPLKTFPKAPYETIKYSRERQVFLANGSKVYISSLYYDKEKALKKNIGTGKSLYEISKIKDNINYSEFLLKSICFYIENYAL